MSFSKGKRKFLIIISIIFGVLLFSQHLFAYDETIIHPSLTVEAAKLYNLNFDEKLTGQETEWIRQGSIDEDDVDYLTMRARSSNHFYDPVNKTGWTNTKTLEILGEPSPVWAHDSVKQSLFPRGDYTWERAVYDYVNGNKKHAYEALGHILHLIEDKTVPAHTRNDFHLSPTIAGRDMGEREPFEDWTRNNTRAGNIKFDFGQNLFQENKKPIIFDNLNQYFENIALYTNTRFFSKDTIYAFSEPNTKVIESSEKNIEGDIINYAYGLGEDGKKIKLAKISYSKTNNQKNYTLTELEKSIEDNIYSDYWSRLAPKSILAGAGIIKLFKDEVKKASQNPAAIQKPDTFATYYFTKPAAKTAVAVNSAIITAANNIVSGLNQIKDKIYYSLAPSASSSYTLVFDMSQAIPASSITLLGGVIQVQAAKDTASVQSQILQEPVYNAALVSQSAPEIITEPNKEINLSAQLKNTGTANWQREKIYLNVYLKNDAANQFYHSSWFTPARPAKLNEPQVVPESFGNFNFLIKSPSIAGEYFFKVRPVWQDETGNFNWLGDSIVSWHIRVKSADIAQSESETQDKNSENIVDISQDKGQDTGTSIKNDTEEQDQTPSQNKDNIEKDGEVNKTNENEKSQDSADSAEKNNTDNTEITAPVAPNPVAPFYRRARDIYPPETTIAENPAVNSAGKTSANTALFKFSSSEVDSTFLCSLDSIDFTSCGANKTYKNLSDGGHILKVKAIDRFNNIDETPAEFAWTIDSAPPAKITDFSAAAGNARGKIKLSWTKPEENVSYEIRYSEKEIVETGTNDNQTNWQNAVQISETIDNNAEQIGVGDLTHFVPGKTYYFAIKSKDGLNNISEISNSPSSSANVQTNHIVISEVQIAGSAADDEFIELYNPTSSAVSLSGWRLTRKTASGATTENLLTSFPDKTISARGYFLVTHSGYDGNVAADAAYSTQSSLASNNTIILYSDAGTNVVDLVGMGSAANYEGVTMTNPSDNGSIERKVNYSSTAESMSGGPDKYLGNGWDSDNNSADFILRTISEPQNSQSPVEPIYAPEKISDFSVIAVAGNSHTIKLIWTAPYGNFGNPEKLFYDIRYSTNEITAQNFGSAYSVFGITPLMRLTFIPVKAAGGAQELTIEGLSLGKTYYFAIKTTDITRNIDRPESEISFASYPFPAPNIQIFLQNLEKSYFGSSTNLGSNSLPPNVWPQVSQTIGRGFDQRLVKATARVKCNSASACNVSFKAFYLSAYPDSGYTNLATGNNGFSSSGGMDNDPSSIPAGADMDVNFSGWPSFASILNPVYYYKITFQFWTADPVQWGGSTQDSYANGKSIIEDYPGGADLYFKLWSE